MNVTLIFVRYVAQQPQLTLVALTANIIKYRTIHCNS